MTHIPPVTYIENDYIFDEKRRTVVNLRSANPFQQYIYSRNYFKSMRPDLNAYDFLIWKDKFNLGDRYLNELRLRVNKEIHRFYHQHTLTERRNLGVFNKIKIKINN